MKLIIVCRPERCLLKDNYKLFKEPAKDGTFIIRLRKIGASYYQPNIAALSLSQYKEKLRLIDLDYYTKINGGVAYLRIIKTK